MAINSTDTLSFRPMSDVAYHPSGRRSSRRGGGRRDFVAGDIVEVSCYSLGTAFEYWINKRVCDFSHLAQPNGGYYLLKI